MSNTARKIRKFAGIPFSKESKVGTPLLERQSFLKLPIRKQATEIEARGIELTKEEEGQLVALDAQRRNTHRANSGYQRNYSR